MTKGVATIAAKVGVVAVLATGVYTVATKTDVVKVMSDALSGVKSIMQQDSSVKVSLFHEMGATSTESIPDTGLVFNLPKGETESFYIQLENTGSTDYGSLTINKDDDDWPKTEANVSLPKENVDERIVYNWEQKKAKGYGTNLTYTNNVSVDELLVKTNKIDYLSSSVTGDNSPQKSVPPIDQFGTQLKNLTSAPALDFKLNKAGTAGDKVRLYFKISSPNAAGEYDGPIKIVNKDDNNTEIAHFNVKVIASDKTLAQPVNYTFGCYTNDRIRLSETAPNSLEAYYITKDLFDERLTTIRNMGCNSLMVRLSAAADNVQMMKSIQAAGFSSVLVDINYIRSGNTEEDDSTLAPEPGNGNDTTARAQFKKIVRQILCATDPVITIPISFYGIDEPNSKAPDYPPDRSFPSSYATYEEYLAAYLTGANVERNYTKAKVKISNIKELFDEVVATNGKGSFTGDVTSAMTSATYLDFQAEADYHYHTDSPILHYSYNCYDNPKIPNGTFGQNSGILCSPAKSMQSLLQGYAANPSSVPANATYYFQANREQPKQNRYEGGLGLIVTGLKGYYLNVVYAYVLQRNADKSIMVEPLFAENSTDSQDNSNVDKQNMLMYPASDGLVPTVQSEEIREGIMDIKYYLTYKDIISKMETKCTADGALKAVDEWKQKIEGTAPSVDANNLAALTTKDLQLNSPNSDGYIDSTYNGYSLVHIPGQNSDVSPTNPSKSIAGLRDNLKGLFVEYSNRCNP